MKRWNLREVDGGPLTDRLYDGMETDQEGEWVLYDDVVSTIADLECKVAAAMKCVASIDMMLIHSSWTFDEYCGKKTRKRHQEALNNLWANLRRELGAACLFPEDAIEFDSKKIGVYQRAWKDLIERWGQLSKKSPE